MTYANARIILGLQAKNLRKIRDVRIRHNGYEYRVNYWGGFAAYIAVDRRQIGKRNFKYFAGVDGSHCLHAEDAMKLVMRTIEEKG